MNIYVAASSHEIPRAQKAMNALRKAGHTITSDWTETMLSASGPDDTLDRETLREVAEECMRGVQNAQLLLLLLPEGTSTGAWTELGIALAEDIFIVVAGTKKRSCFWALADDVYDTDDEAIASIIESGGQS